MDWNLIQIVPKRCLLGKRQRLAVLRRSVKPFPRGKHYRFNSYLSHCLETESLVIGKAQSSA
nr:MAG TPA: hypothetical protein [Caudoviricetes sp.]